jgi:hypothetical protein
MYIKNASDVDISHFILFFRWKSHTNRIVWKYLSRMKLKRLHSIWMQHSTFSFHFKNICSFFVVVVQRVSYFIIFLCVVFFLILYGRWLLRHHIYLREKSTLKWNTFYYSFLTQSVWSRYKLVMCFLMPFNFNWKLIVRWRWYH